MAGLTLSITVQTNGVLLKAVDPNYISYKTKITSRDPFVHNFCGGDVNLIYKLLKENEKKIKLEEGDNDVALRLTEPVILTYSLKRDEASNSGEQISLILGQLSKTLERLDVVERRTDDLEEQLSLGIIFPGYGMGVVERTTSKLYMTFGSWEDRQIDLHNGSLHPRNSQVTRIDDRSNNYQFSGSSLKQLQYLSELKDFRFGSYDENANIICGAEQCPVQPTEFGHLSSCVKLTELWLMGTNIDDISWAANLKNLEFIRLRRSPNLCEIRYLLSCPKLKLIDIRECGNVKNIPNFPSHVEILK